MTSQTRCWCGHEFRRHYFFSCNVCDQHSPSKCWCGHHIRYHRNERCTLCFKQKKNGQHIFTIIEYRICECRHRREFHEEIYSGDEHEQRECTRCQSCLQYIPLFPYAYKALEPPLAVTSTNKINSNNQEPGGERPLDKSLLITPNSRVVNLKDDGSWEYVTFPQSSLDTLQAIKQTPAALKFFHGLFDIAGIRVLDTGETFTCVQTDTGIEFIDGINENSVGYTVQIYAYQAERLARYLQTEDIDEIEQYRIVRSLYEPMSSAALKNTGVLWFMNNPLISLLVNRKRVVHIELLSPNPEQENHAYYTLFGVSKQWLILDGHHGTPDKMFSMNHLHVLEMCRHVTTTLRTEGWIGWIKLAKWYVGWRKKVQSNLSN